MSWTFDYYISEGNVASSFIEAQNFTSVPQGVSSTEIECVQTLFGCIDLSLFSTILLVEVGVIIVLLLVVLFKFK